MHHHRLHERSANTTILQLGIDCDRPHAGYVRAFVQAIAASNAASDLGNHAVETWVRKHHPEHACRGAWIGKIAREAVTLTECVECVIADLPANGRIFRFGFAHFQFWVRSG
jgi:hypothetical protein